MENKDELILSDYDLSKWYFNADCFINANDSDIDKITFGELFNRYKVETYQHEVGKCYIEMEEDQYMNCPKFTFIKVKSVVDGEHRGEYIEVTPYNLFYMRESRILDKTIAKCNNRIKEIPVEVFNTIKKKVVECKNACELAASDIVPFSIKEETSEYIRPYNKFSMDGKMGIPYSKDFLNIKISDFKKALKKYNSCTMDKLDKALRLLKEEFIKGSRYLLIKGNGDDDEFNSFLFLDDFYVVSRRDTGYGITTYTIRCKYHFIDSLITKDIFICNDRDNSNVMGYKDMDIVDLLSDAKKKYFLNNKQFGDRLSSTYKALYGKVLEISYDILGY